MNTILLRSAAILLVHLLAFILIATTDWRIYLGVYLFVLVNNFEKDRYK